MPNGPYGCSLQQQLGSRWSPTDDCSNGMNVCKRDDGDRSGDEGPVFSLHSQEGDTEAAHTVRNPAVPSS